MVVVLAQALWLIPALDLRVAAIQAGQGPLPPSNLHAVYVGAEIAKLIWLLYVGLVPAPASASGTLPTSTAFPKLTGVMEEGDDLAAPIDGPGEMVCDRVGLTNEHERGMMRMFVNMLICTAIAGLVMWATWTIWTTLPVGGTDRHLCAARWDGSGCSGSIWRRADGGGPAWGVRGIEAKCRGHCACVTCHVHISPLGRPLSGRPVPWKSLCWTLQRTLISYSIGLAAGLARPVMG